MQADVQIKYAKMPDGLTFFYHLLAPVHPRAIAVFVHDIGDHICRHEKTMQALVQRGCVCAAFDQRGHGRSGGRRCHARNMDEWMDDLGFFIENLRLSQPAGLPVFIVGIGAGATVALMHVIKHSPKIAGMVLVAPAIRQKQEFPPWKLKAMKAVSGIIPWVRVRRRASPQMFTRDAAQAEDVGRDPLVSWGISVSAAVDFIRCQEYIEAMSHRIYTPMLIMAGSADPICDSEAARKFARHLASSDKEFRLFADMRHDLLHESEGEKVMAELVGWIDKRATGPELSDEQLTLKGEDLVW